MARNKYQLFYSVIPLCIVYWVYPNYNIRIETFIVISLYKLNYCSQHQVKTVQKHKLAEATRPYAQPGSQLATAS